MAWKLSIVLIKPTEGKSPWPVFFGQKVVLFQSKISRKGALFKTDGHWWPLPISIKWPKWGSMSPLEQLSKKWTPALFSLLIARSTMTNTTLFIMASPCNSPMLSLWATLIRGRIKHRLLPMVCWSLNGSMPSEREILKTYMANCAKVSYQTY